MKFLVDAQLPPALADWLREQGHDARHVVSSGLGLADDRVIWDQAVRTGEVILTKDEDFASRQTLATDGPQVVWVRLGNATRRETLRWFESVFPALLVALERGDRLIEVT